MKKTLKTKMASYCPPRILQTVRVMLEEDLLAGSNQVLEATGQQVEKVNSTDNWSDSGVWID